MFGAAFFGARYFAPRYFGEVGGTPVALISNPEYVVGYSSAPRRTVGYAATPVRKLPTIVS